MKIRTLLGSTSIIALAATLGTSAAFAQSTEKSTAIQEVTVTAQKTRTSASKTPISLTVVNSAALHQAGIVDVSHLAAAVPALNVGYTAHGVNLDIRGIGTTDPTSKGSQDVAVNIDGVPVGYPEVMGVAFFDLDDVEVLRGPQGTLYGTSSTGGVININSAVPKDTFDATGKFDLGNYDTRRGEVMLNAPITDALAIRLAGSYNDRQGFLKPDLYDPSVYPAQTGHGEDNLNDENNIAWRASARYKFDDRGSLLINFLGGHIGGMGCCNGILIDNLGKSWSQAQNVYYNPMVGGISRTFHNYTANFNYDLTPEVRLTYVGGYQSFHADDNQNNGGDVNPASNEAAATAGYSETNAADNGQFGWSVYKAKITTVSNELRFSNPSPQSLDWMVGGNLQREVIDEKDLNGDVMASCAPSIDLSCVTQFGPDIDGPDIHTAYGFFTNDTYHFNDQYAITGGVRYTHDKMGRYATVIGGPASTSDAGPSGVPGSCSVVVPCVAGSGYLDDTGSETDSDVTWLAKFVDQFTPNQMGYVSVSTGFKSGGFNDYNPTSPGSPAPYGPEKLTAYEIGYKGRPLSNLQFNADAYYYDFSKYQLTGSVFVAPGAVVSNPVVMIFTKDVPAKAYGLETETRWNATPDDTFSLSTTLGRAYITSATVGFLQAFPYPWNNKDFDDSPHFTANMGYTHNFDRADGSIVKFNIQSLFNSGYYESSLGGSESYANDAAGYPPFGVPSSESVAEAYGANAPYQYRQPAFTRTNIDVGYTAPNGKLSVDLWVRNVEGNVQITGPVQTPNYGQQATATTPREYGYNSVTVSDPRTYGVTLNLKY